MSISAQLNETLLNCVSHPLLWGMAQIARRLDPMLRVPGLGIVVSDAACAREILQRDEDFTKNGPGSLAQTITLGLGPTALGNMDGSEHHKIRQALAGSLTPQHAERLVSARTASLETLVLHLARGDRVDLVHFIRGWTSRLAFDVIGVPPPVGNEEEACHEVVRLSECLAAVIGFRRLSTKQMRKAEEDCAQLASYFRDGYQHPATASSIANRLHSFGLPVEDALGLLMIFMIGGTLTISAALPRIVALLVDNGLFMRLSKDPKIIARVIDEGLRFVTPLPGTVRIATRDVAIGGLEVTAGTRLVILTCNVTRDPKLFPNPDQFDLSRVHNPRSGRPWYGAGAHHCPGIHLAQQELKEIFGALANLGKDLRILKRRAAIGALLPAYRQLVVQTVDSGSK